MAKINNSENLDTLEFLQILKKRIDKNIAGLKDISTQAILDKLSNNPVKLNSLIEMEKSGGEPNLVAYDNIKDEYTFFDCSVESPAGRRSLCYDRKAWESRKDNRPENNALDFAASMGIELLTELDYLFLQSLGKFDTKTSSWLMTSKEVRDLGGAIYGDFRYGRTFFYHNGASSYYAVRGFRGKLIV